MLAKGKSAPVPAWLAVRATSQIGERPTTPVPMVGRERELGVLTGIWERVIEEGRAQLATVFGPAGIGKSRLGIELATLVADQGARVLRGRATPYGASAPYSAFAQLVKQTATIFDSDEPAEARAKLAAAIAQLAGPAAAEEHAPQLEVLLGVGSEGTVADRETLFFSARVFVESLAVRGPTMLLFEDIHWADSSQLDLLETLASRVRDVPVMFVALARPELLGERPTWGGGLPAYTALQLDPLSDESSQELAEQFLAARAVAQGASKVAEMAEGNPLFIEELAASIAERSTSDDLPTSVRAIIAARLDSLPPGERTVLVDASVAGRVFWRGALTEMAPHEDLAGSLNALEHRGLIGREAVSRIKGDQQFAFKHALIHDVAYQTLPRAARRERHAAVARFLSAATATGQSHEALALHWREAGESDRAVDELVAAAELAGRGWAKDHAVTLYSQALELVGDDEQRRRSIRLKQVVMAQAFAHLAQDDVGRPTDVALRGRVVDEREVGGRHVAGDLVDHLHVVVAEIGRVLADHLLTGRVVDAERFRSPVRADDDVAVLPDDLGVAVMTDRLRARCHGRKRVHVDGVRPLDEIPRHGLIVAGAASGRSDVLIDVEQVVRVVLRLDRR